MTVPNSYRSKLEDDLMKVCERWCTPSEIKLRAGEMTVQELRTACAVANGMANEIRLVLSRPDGPVGEMWQKK